MRCVPHVHVASVQVYEGCMPQHATSAGGMKTHAFPAGLAPIQSLPLEVQEDARRQEPTFLPLFGHFLVDVMVKHAQLINCFHSALSWENVIDFNIV